MAYREAFCHMDRSLPSRGDSQLLPAHRYIVRRVGFLQGDPVSNRQSGHTVAGAKRYSLQEHLAPEMVFSSGAFSHVQWSAASLPQEHLACLAQQHPASPEMLQQVDGCIFAVLFNSMALRFESAVSFQGVTMCV